MTIQQQMKRVRRIEADFRKEAQKHFNDNNSIAGNDCEEMAETMQEVAKTLMAARDLTQALEILSS